MLVHFPFPNGTEIEYDVDNNLLKIKNNRKVFSTLKTTLGNCTKIFHEHYGHEGLGQAFCPELLSVTSRTEAPSNLRVTRRESKTWKSQINACLTLSEKQ